MTFSACSLVAVQGALQTACKESEFCGAILKQWGGYHRIKTNRGNDEARFRRLFREITPTTFVRVKRDKIDRLYDDFKELKIRDMARDLIRFGINENKTADEVARIFQEQMDWLKENEELTKQTANPSRPCREIRIRRRLTLSAEVWSQKPVFVLGHHGLWCFIPEATWDWVANLDMF